MTAPLAGTRVLALGGGAAGGYAARLLSDAGAEVLSSALDESQRQAGIVRADLPVELAYAQWLTAGQTLVSAPADPTALQALAASVDLLLLGEACGADALSAADRAALRGAPRVATVALSWLGGPLEAHGAHGAQAEHASRGELAGWRGCDLIVQALCATPQMVGPADGMPIAIGDRHSTQLAGVTAYIAACAALLGAPESPAIQAPRELDVSILEANLVMAEMHMHYFERDGLPMRRCGINRFAPNSPVGIYPCRDGWVGITVSTPDQWRALCQALELHEQAADQSLVTRELRFDRLDEVEAVLCRTLAPHTAEHWAAVGRRFKVPIVVVPDAAGILTHPIFRERQSLTEMALGAQTVKLPRTPFGLTATPIRTRLPPAQAWAESAAGASPPGLGSPSPARSPAPAAAPLAGLRLVDFSMGWAGPLASRLMADLGAEVLKIEAGRYPDWWRGLNWSPAFIAEQGHEKATIYCAMNRGKQGVSLDLTKPAGRDLALALVAGADAVVENQAAGVMAKFGLDYAQMAQVQPDVVMLSMSAFGTGNAWSDTRAYGSTLEQGSGLPSMTGLSGTAPTMTHLAHGDPVGGLYGCAALLTALVHRRRSGQGQYVNLSMVEAMLQLTTSGLLSHQISPDAPLRRGNRRAAMAPHGFFPSAGSDQWLAVAVDSACAFAALALAIGQPDWAQDPDLATLAGRQAREDQIDAAIAAWSATLAPEVAAQRLQAAGVMAAPLLHADQMAGQAHLASADFFIDLERAVSGPQRQAGLSIRQGGQRLGARTPAPLLGEHTAAVLQRLAGVSPARFEALVREGIVSLAPRPERNLVG